MACSSCGAARAARQAAEAAVEYTVTYPDGRTEIVQGEHNAKVKITMAGGGTYTKR